MYWDMVGMVALGYTAIMSPYQVGFFSKADPLLVCSSGWSSKRPADPPLSTTVTVHSPAHHPTQ